MVALTSEDPIKLPTNLNLNKFLACYFIYICSFIRPDKCNAGDVLVLTKPLGTQVLETNSSVYPCQIDI